jgi:hypothetical protein
MSASFVYELSAGTDRCYGLCRILLANTATSTTDVISSATSVTLQLFPTNVDKDEDLATATQSSRLWLHSMLR